MVHLITAVMPNVTSDSHYKYTWDAAIEPSTRLLQRRGHTRADVTVAQATLPLQPPHAHTYARTHVRPPLSLTLLESTLQLHSIEYSKRYVLNRFQIFCTIVDDSLMSCATQKETWPRNTEGKLNVITHATPVVSTLIFTQRGLTVIFSV